jgi:GR25 family glycosyltransferase involved in LPS biosynthesis
MIQAYIINLDNRTDLKSHILTEMTKLPQVSYEIVSAIRDESKTCFLSHLKCIQRAKDNNLPYVLILEDDAIFTEDCIEIFDRALTEVQTRQWDMLYLGANLNSNAYKITPTLVKLSGAYTTHAYIVHEQFYDTILNLQLDVEIDVCYTKLMPDNNIYMCNPMIAYQLPSYSDLQDGFRDYNEAIDRNFLTYVKI